MIKLTLVAYYGIKQEELNRIIKYCSQVLKNSLLSDYYHSYSSNQIHATLVGLECFVESGKMVNNNLFKKYGRMIPARPGLLPNIIYEVLPLTFRVGGFHQDNILFKSAGLSPYERMFHINRSTNQIVVMGWPHTNELFFDRALAGLRTIIETKCNISHKYEDDNDLYFVLGTINSSSVGEQVGIETELLQIEKTCREYLLNNPEEIILNKENLSLVSYSTTDLAESTSEIFAIETAEEKINELIKNFDHKKK